MAGTWTQMLGVPLPPGPGGTFAPAGAVAASVTAPAATRPASALTKRVDILRPSCRLSLYADIVLGSATQPLPNRYRLHLLHVGSGTDEVLVGSDAYEYTPLAFSGFGTELTILRSGGGHDQIQRLSLTDRRRSLPSPGHSTAIAWSSSPLTPTIGGRSTCSRERGGLCDPCRWGSAPSLARRSCLPTGRGCCWIWRPHHLRSGAQRP
jgi:hypothetical protein